MSKSISPRPAARRHRLIVSKVGRETLLYDLDRNKAHCLNETATLLWDQCDGQTTVEVITERLAALTGGKMDDKVLWLALEDLSRKQLLSEEIRRPPEMAGITRRQLVRRAAGAAAATVPLITSLVAPRAVQAGTCTPSGQPCTSSAQCCSGICKGDGTCA